MCNQVVSILVLDHFIKQDICIEAVEVDPWSLYDVPDLLKTKQKMCEKAVKDDPFSQRFVPDWFVVQEQINVWYDDDYWHHDDEMIEWYKGYKK